MAKCKKCGIEDLTWDREYHESTAKWRLWNPQTERPHACVQKKTGNYEEQGMSNHDKSLWKKDWKPIMDVKSRRVCGICKQEGVESVCVTVTDCEYCEQFKLNPCEDWCPKCGKHPKIIEVEKDPIALAEFYKKFPNELPT